MILLSCLGRSEAVTVVMLTLSPHRAKVAAKPKDTTSPAAAGPEAAARLNSRFGLIMVTCRSQLLQLVEAGLS